LCAETAPEVFELREDAKSWVRDLASSEISDERLSEARDLCPWMAISVERPVSDQPETGPTA
jgi:ferredoxin